MDIKNASYCSTQRAQKQAILDYASLSNCEFNYAVTLTTQNEIKSIDTFKRCGQYFVNRYNYALGFKNYKRKAKHDPTMQAAILAVLEGNGKNGQNGKKFHYHLAVHKPDRLSNDDFEQLVKRCWNKSNDGNTYKSTVRPMYSFGWIEYIVKDITHYNNDVLDFERTHVY